MNANHHWADRGANALKAGVFLSVLALIALIATHAPKIADEATIETVTAATTSAPATTPTARAAATPKEDAKPYYYFPSEYQLNAPEPGEPVPTF